MTMLKIGKYSLGVGDRFAHQAKAQLQACCLAEKEGVEILPVWNKSYREHTTIGSVPQQLRDAADEAVATLNWKKPYFVDADHINLKTVDGFLESSNFFTIDVAEAIGKPTDTAVVDAFLKQHADLVGDIKIPGIDRAFQLSRQDVAKTAMQYLDAVKTAGEIYRHIEKNLGVGNFVTEVSMDETDNPQTPPELLVVLAALSDEKIPLQTIAPKFTGRFNKGVDYEGDPASFEQEFRDDLAVIAHAVTQYSLPNNLKLSVHSGSDKFSIYEPIRRALNDTGAGLHIKTAGTTWLEELIGLAEAGGDGLELAKEVYAQAYQHRQELCEPYETVIDIDQTTLPAPDEVRHWTADQYTSALRHDQANDAFNPSLRQLLHVGYKIAAKMGDRYLKMLVQCESTISKNVTDNLYKRHLKPLFLG